MNGSDAQYERAATAASQALTTSYSTSFPLGIRLFGRSIRQPVYDVYGLVRLADEIVDSWHHLDQPQALDALEREVAKAVSTGFSLNLIVHAYARTARQFDFEPGWTKAFFDSMRADLRPDPVVTPEELDRYVYGSAEVIGLMCLRVFVGGRQGDFVTLAPGARALGSAFQKVNFLRDYAADRELGRTYFPETRSNGLTDAVKSDIITSIKAEFQSASAALHKLPPSSRAGVSLAYTYYGELLERLEQASAAEVSQRRIRVPDARKLMLFMARLVRRT